MAYITISLISYMCFLNGIYVIPFVYLSVALLALHTYVGMDLAKQIKAAGAPGIPHQH